MLTILGRGTKLCDGVTRRELMRVGALSLLGGLSHQDMVDLKPHAPAEIRGEFKPIATSVPGIRICEHLPRLAKLMHRACLIRTFTHGFNSHDPLPFMTGYTDQGFLAQAQPSDPPDIGAVCQYLGLGRPDLPGAVCMPCYPGWGEKWKRRGPYGGFLGSQYDPMFTRCDPTFDRKPKVNYYDPVLPIGEPLLPTTDLPAEVTVDRVDAR